MRFATFAVSSIAWPPAAMGEALAMLPALGCTAVEIAPFGAFGGWDDIDDQARRLHDDIRSHGLVCSALQGILYGVPDIALFGAEPQRARLLRHLEQVARLARLLGARACVFGAPRQRDPGELPDTQAWRVAVDALRQIAPAFHDAGTALAFEANARHYGCRFVTTTAEAVALVRETAAPGIGLQIDTGTLFLEDEPPGVLAEAADIAVHAHVSEPDLRPPGLCDHTAIAAALRGSGYAGSLSVEMRQVEDWRGAMRSATRFVQGVYV